MSVNWASSSILHPNYLLPIVLKRLQGSFVGKFFFPDVPVENIEYGWYYYGTIGGMTPEVGENDPGTFTHTMYEKRVGMIKFYREKGKISHYARTPYIIRNRAQDEMQHLAERARLRLESLRINAIVNNAFTSVGAKDYFWKDCDDDNSNWIGGTGAVSIINDIIDANQRISEYAKVETDTILCGTRIAAAMKKNLELRDWDRAGPLSVNVIRDGKLIPTGVPGSIGRLAGHEVFSSNVSLLSDQSDEQSALTPLISDDVYIFKRGPELGKMHIFEGMKVLTKVDEMARETQTQLGFAVEPQIYRPQFIYTIANAIA